MGTSSDSWPLKVTRAFIFLCSSCSMWTNVDGSQIFARIIPTDHPCWPCQRLWLSRQNLVDCDMLLNTSLLICLEEKIMSTVLLPNVKPLCVSGMILTQMSSSSQCNKNLAKTFPAAFKSVMILRWWWHISLAALPFYKNTIMVQTSNNEVKQGMCEPIVEF